MASLKMKPKVFLENDSVCRKMTEFKCSYCLSLAQVCYQPFLDRSLVTKMATSETSDTNVTEKCSVCQDQNKSEDAEKFCVECNDFYCSTCVKVHVTLPALRSHKLVDKEDGNYKDCRALPTERCTRHGLKVIDMYCKLHDDVGCHTCMSVDHRSCQEVFYIPEYIRSLTPGTEDSQKQGTETEHALENLLGRLKSDKENLHKNKIKELKKLREYQQKLEDMIRQASERTRTAIENRYDTLNNSILETIHATEETLQRLKGSRENLEQSLTNQGQMFVAVKLQQKVLKDTQSRLEDFRQKNHGRRLLLKSSEQLKAELEKQDAFGVVKESPFRFETTGSFDIKRDIETNSCDIYGICIMDDGSVVVSDKKNKSLKVVNTQNRSITCYEALKSAPWGLCSFKTNKLAVCLPDDETIQIFQFQNYTLTQTGLMKFEFNCRCVSCYEDKLYISDQTCVYICDTNGTVLSLVQQDTSGRALFGDIYTVLVNTSNGNLHVGDEAKGTLTFDTNGKVVNTVPKVELSWPHGMCIGDEANLFVSYYNSKKVFRLSDDGRKKETIAEGLAGPQAICYDPNSARLYISNYNTNVITIYDAD